MSGYEDAVARMKESLADEMRAAGSPFVHASTEDAELFESMKGIVKMLGTRGLDRLMDMGMLDKDEIFAPPPPVRVNPLDPKGPEWKWGVKAWKDAVDEVVKRGDAWVMGRGGVFGPNYGGIYSLWKDEFEREFGFRPTRSKEQSMTKAIEKAMRDAVAKVINVVGTVDPEVIQDIKQKGQ